MCNPPHSPIHNQIHYSHRQRDFSTYSHKGTERKGPKKSDGNGSSLAAPRNFPSSIHVYYLTITHQQHYISHKQCKIQLSLSLSEKHTHPQHPKEPTPWSHLELMGTCHPRLDMTSPCPSYAWSPCDLGGLPLWRMQCRAGAIRHHTSPSHHGIDVLNLLRAPSLQRGLSLPKECPLSQLTVSRFMRGEKGLKERVIYPLAEPHPLTDH